MLFLLQSTVTKYPSYQPPDIVFATPRRRPTQDIIIDDDDEILLAWFMFLRMPYE
jgi:hypothetical protein